MGKFTVYLKQITLMFLCAALLAGCSTSEKLKTSSDGLTQYLQDNQFPQFKNFDFKDVSWVTLSPAGNEFYMLQRQAPAVTVWDLQGNLLRSWTTDQLGYPHSLHFQQLPTGESRVWITDMAPPLTAGKGYGHCLKQFSLNGSFLGAIGVCGETSEGTGLNPVQFDRITDVGFDSRGYLWVADGDINGLNNRVLQIDPSSAKVLQLWSAPNNQAGSGAKEFNLPHAIDVDRCDRVWVADALNHRIQVISSQGKFLQELRCFGNQGVYGLKVTGSAQGNLSQLVTTSSPTASPVGGDVKIFNISPACEAPLPVPAQCTPAFEWSITLPQGSSEAMLHMIDATQGAGTLLIAPLGGDLPPQKWNKVWLPAE